LRKTRAQEAAAAKKADQVATKETKKLGKAATKKRKIAEAKLAADIKSDEIEESEIVYIRDVAPTPEPKRSARLAKKVKT
jgi:hypothetical protein